MKVLAYDPFIPDDAFSRAGVARVDLPTLLATSDYISVHTPLTPETKHLFNRETFGTMKRGAYLVNTARGPIIDEAALAEALDSGQIAGAALDVMTQEPPPSSPLFGRDNVIITPHTSFYSEESLIDLQVKAAQEVVAVLSGGTPRNPVNPEVLAHR
jgi:D-3-phosphoglycerate dehydrogenase